ncbi:cytochrome P450, partial [Aspergillus multicolor]|uniref:cytochrome P450 n=1 Tax=Aspergillus multicolor TaxID=41759 RepID=UPI003CCE2D0F
MAREYRRVSEFLFSQIGLDANQINVYQFCYATVSSITSAVLIGEDLTHIGGWNEIVMEYFPEAWRIRNALWHWPRVLRPFVKPLLVRNNQLESIITKAENFLKEPVRKRREPANQDVDVLKFLAEYGESERKIAMQIVGIITGALNTSTHALTQAIYDLCSHPEYIEPIRTEALDALASEGGQWTLSATKKLHLLDAFLKESLRLFAPEGLAVTRVSTGPITLSDGTHIPTGTYLSVAGEAMALDDEFYPHASEFNPRRFLGKDGKPVTPESVFHGIEAGNGNWGAGRLTCPGRHFASAMAKIIVASLVIKFDVKFPGDQKEGPKGVEDDCNYVPDLGQKVVLTERV